MALTGRSDAYYSDYRGTAQELLSVIKRGFVYQGQRYEWQNKPRGTVVRDEPTVARTGVTMMVNALLPSWLRADAPRPRLCG